MATFRDICKSRNIPHTCDDSWGGDIIASACIQIASTVDRRLLEGVWIAEPYIEENYDKNNPINILDGKLNLPQGYGLGVNPDESKFGPPTVFD